MCDVCGFNPAIWPCGCRGRLLHIYSIRLGALHTGCSGWNYPHKPISGNLGLYRQGKPEAGTRSIIQFAQHPLTGACVQVTGCHHWPGGLSLGIFCLHSYLSTDTYSNTRLFCGYSCSALQIPDRITVSHVAYLCMTT